MHFETQALGFPNILPGFVVVFLVVVGYGPIVVSRSIPGVELYDFGIIGNGPGMPAILFICVSPIELSLI